MKVVTEALIRAELKATKPEVYYIQEGKILSPAAREYLQGMQVEIDFEKNRRANEAKKQKKLSETENTVKKEQVHSVSDAKYIDYETGAAYMKKPEHMTQLYGNFLVDKNHPRIKYRGKLDRLQAEVVNAQCVIGMAESNELLIKDLGNILDILREMMRCEVMDEAFTNEYIIGLNHTELREHSHNPMKYYKIKQMLLPDYTMGIAHSQLNIIRTSIRETEVLAVDAFKENRKLARTDIIEELNRLSSALHIMMCKYLAGEYEKK
ncbi:MAG: ATP-binding protein [Hornefia sp.]|nr:ATP-binding protein [Hornefia sp.]